MYMYVFKKCICWGYQNLVTWDSNLHFLWFLIERTQSWKILIKIYDSIKQHWFGVKQKGWSQLITTKVFLPHQSFLQRCWFDRILDKRFAAWRRLAIKAIILPMAFLVVEFLSLFQFAICIIPSFFRKCFLESVFER